ncbi:class I SAM-dependent methyltransferase [Paenibacillus sp. CAA11]|uniref:class I SAM-dependent methyltransferase n=1 Tax=Paenibacillus sp. CAA11 TaxID=1532905 RepID=UPI00131ED345|nr:class I SAM-dependent methyltransferase [Paenibacillus sp. CAA11]
MDRFEQARQAETDYHKRFYRENEVFENGTWISEPNRIVMELLERVPDSDPQVLDLACGVGRNTLPIASILKESGGRITGVDLLGDAVNTLKKKARELGLDDVVVAVESDAEQFDIKKNAYDYILACSCLEHLSSEEAMLQMIDRMQQGTKVGGIHCLSLCTDVVEIDKVTREAMEALIELPLSSDRAWQLLKERYMGWNVLRRQVVPQCIDETKYDKSIEFRTNLLTFAVQKV